MDGKCLIGWVPFVRPNINGFTMQKWDGSTPPLWKMEAFGYGTKPMGGVGLRMESIPTFSVGRIPHGFTCRDESMAKFFTTIIQPNHTNSLRKLN